MKKVKLILGVFMAMLILPVMANAEETSDNIITTTDNTAIVRLYENDKDGKEIYMSEPIKNGDTYIYSATIISEKDRKYYVDVKPNYDYESIKYSAPTISYSGLGWHPFRFSSELVPYFITGVDQPALNLTGEVLVTVTKKDTTIVKYLLSIAAKDKTVYVGEEQDTIVNNNNNIQNNNNKTTEIEEQTVENPHTGIFIGISSLVAVIAATLLLKKKNKFNRV